MSGGKRADLNLPGGDTGSPAEIEPIVRTKLQQQPRERNKIIRLMVGGNQQLGTAAANGFGHALKGFCFRALHVHFHIAHIQLQLIHGNGGNRMKVRIFSGQIGLDGAVSAAFSRELQHIMTIPAGIGLSLIHI